MFSNSSSVHISFLIGGLNNEYLFQIPRIHKLMRSMSRNGGEFMSWSPSESAALLYIYI